MIDEDLDEEISEFVRGLEQGLGAVEATEDAESSWDRQINEIADRTLYPSANSWYMGASLSSGMGACR